MTSKTAKALYVNGDKRAVSNIDKANLLADHFSQMFIVDDGNMPVYEPVVSNFMHAVPWFQEKEIYDIIIKWKKSYSLTPDFIPLFFVQKVAHVIAKPLAYLYNQSLMFSEIPERWKRSFVTPLLKKEPAKEPANYRPVSVLSFFGRVFEKIIKNCIVEHVEKNFLIPESQHGFVGGRSVETNLLESFNDWTSLIDEKKCCDVVFFDFSKAFDRVSHSKLMFKLIKIGLHPLLLKWLGEYLTGRTLQVKVKNAFSTIRNVTSGVPQGGVLSPILFSIYTADLPNVLRDSRVVCKQFADDLKIYCEFVEDDSQCLQQAIDIVEKWSKSWQLPLAAEKTKVMRIGKSNSIPNYEIGGLPIAVADKVVDLGFHYNNKLNFQSTID